MKAYVVEREHLAQNIRAIREEAGESIVWAVLKGNGYGLGVVQINPPLPSLRMRVRADLNL